MIRDHYEISLWEDVYIPYSESEDGVVFPHYEEEKIGVIGSDTVTASCRALEPKLVENINGTHTFTFKMLYTCRDDSLEEVIQQFVTANNEAFVTNNNAILLVRSAKFVNHTYPNPFLNLLVNERKVKVKWKNKWYDFLIKDCQEDSNEKSITYTCTDVFINELSKTGFDIELDSELQNNQGTITELAEKILEGTDWQVDIENSDIIEQWKEEAVYEVTLSTTISGAWREYFATSDSYIISTGSTILIPYSQIKQILDTDGRIGLCYPFHFVYNNDGYNGDGTDMLVTNLKDDDYYCFGPVTWTKDINNNITIGPTTDPYFTFSPTTTISSEYRVKWRVKQEKTIFDPVAQRYCDVYEVINPSGITPDGFSHIDPGAEIYGFKEVKYRDPTFVNNLIVNAKDFTSTAGWQGTSNNPPTFALYPTYGSSSSQYNGASYLILNSGDYNNNGLKENSTYAPDGFAVGDKYVFRFQAYEQQNNEFAPGSASGDITIQIKDNEDTPYLSCSGFSEIGDDDWCECTCEFIKSLPRAEIYNKNAVFQINATATRWIKEIQFFPYCEGLNSDGEVTRINPGQMDLQSLGTTIYTYYKPDPTAGSLENIPKYWQNDREWEPISNGDVVHKYNTKIKGEKVQCEKIRSITAKQSNRFNLLQELAEKFECWVHFEIGHDSTGRISYENEDTNLDWDQLDIETSEPSHHHFIGTAGDSFTVDSGQSQNDPPKKRVPQKKVVFKTEIGQETGVGFVYGIDLKTIRRTIQSDQIVTKTIVPQNNNEFGKDGFCSIARSSQNYPHTNFILNFDYYIAHGLIDATALNQDLYSSTGSIDGTHSIGYYYKLNLYNNEYDNITYLLTSLTKELSRQKSYKTIYETTIYSIEDQIQQIQSELIKLAGATNWEGAWSYISANMHQDQIKSRITAIASLQKMQESYEALLRNIETSITNLNNSIDSKTARQEELVKLIRAVNLSFYKKYSRFIQEGSWISEDYVDDNLYYLDALSVAYTSSRPQVSYDVSVLRLSALEDFKNKVFGLGDISFIEDTDFFGYIDINGIRTPYREKVLISEITSNFDEPDKDTFKVQNYKTQFEDLFQRVVSTTQSLQFASGAYARATSIMQPDGTINESILQASFAQNEQLVYSANNECIVQDATGITLTDLNNPNRKTRITSGGIFITVDGGTTWKNAVSGAGITTQYLTSGMIDAGAINIIDGDHPTFRWDAQGISAFSFTTDTGTYPNFNKYTRFDRFGFYGIDSNSSTEITSLNDVYNNAKFGMTWEKFFMKNNYGTHSVEISNDNDFQVVSSGGTRLVKIGKLTSNPDAFGLQICDFSGTTILEATNNSDLNNSGLWLKDKLKISSSNSNAYSVKIGYQVGTSKAIDTTFGTTYVYPMMNVNDNFIVYENGDILANSGEFHGVIQATGGYFGSNNVQITSQGILIYGAEDDIPFEIRAEDGSSVLKFQGDTLFLNNIKAQSGTIGGFTIYNNQLKSRGDLITLNGSEGYIYAQNITLGDQANIESRLYLGDFIQNGDLNYSTILYNPSKNEEHLALGVFKNGSPVIRISALGRIYVGPKNSSQQITIDGNTSTISGSNFSITPDISTFNNINATGKISTVVFETNHVQSVGGAMIFKDSYKIKYRMDVQGPNGKWIYVFILEEEFRGQINDLIYIIDKNGKKINLSNNTNQLKVYSFDNANLGIMLESEEPSHGPKTDLSEAFSLIDLGAPGDACIGINSNQGSVGYLRPYGITISEVESDLQETKDPMVFIGNLDTANIQAISDIQDRGNGLFSQNVFLTGSLITKVEENGYSGINTLNGAHCIKVDNDTSEIVFWAGAAGTTIEEIQNAPFQVTRQGSIYATRASFTGSVFVGSELYGADIYAARVHGTGNSTEGLSFYNTEQGISFFDKETNEVDVSKIFYIGTGGFFKNDGEPFIEITKDKKAYGVFNKISLKGTTSSLEISNKNILEKDKNGKQISRIHFSDNSIHFKVLSEDASSSGSEDEELVIFDNEIQLNSNIINFNSNFRYYSISDNNNEKKGYNLFIY